MDGFKIIKKSMKILKEKKIATILIIKDHLIRTRIMKVMEDYVVIESGSRIKFEDITDFRIG